MSEHLPRRQVKGQGRGSPLCSLPGVTVVQTCDQRQSDNLALFRRFDGTRLWTILVQCAMGAVAMMISEIIAQHLVKKSTENNSFA